MEYQDTYHLIFQDIALNSTDKKSCLIGVTGPMAIGKSTFSQTLKDFLELKLPHKTISIVHTDCFLMPNAVLKEKNLMSRKGFPVSFNQVAYFEFLEQIKYHPENEVTIPFYDHNLKDIDPNKNQVIKKSDIYILEGINLFFPPPEGFASAEKNFDILILLKMPEEDIKKQFQERFAKAYEYSKTHNTEYFSHLKDYTEEQLREYQEDLWQNIHLAFKHQYIDPNGDLASYKVEVPHWEQE